MWPCSGLPWRKRLAADGGSHFLGLSSDGSEVRHQDPLRFERGLVSGWLIRMSHSDRLLAGELASLLCCLALNVSLLSMSSCSLPPPPERCATAQEGAWCLVVVIWSVQNHHHGLRGWSILRPWCGSDGSRWCPHATPPGDGETRAPLSARGRIELVGGALEDGTQWW
jgi:hypothetical protein